MFSSITVSYCLILSYLFYLVNSLLFNQNMSLSTRLDKRGFFYIELLFLSSKLLSFLYTINAGVNVKKLTAIYFYKSQCPNQYENVNSTPWIYFKFVIREIFTHSLSVFRYSRAPKPGRFNQVLKAPGKTGFTALN